MHREATVDCFAALAMTTERAYLNPTDTFPSDAEIDGAKIAGLNRQRWMAGAGGDDLAGFQRHAELAQFIGEPGQRYPGIAEHVLAVTDELLAAHA